ncbi:tubulin-like doman-containing protein [Umezawaea endophytica]|uniref:Tubulin-like doman-containing protein n=1 Tax=Umezawaea endophytica TaxID=1654476 RepID=A0A9X3AFR4_9PSEU|nr:tubulin-like doman-containing protein [Umezawaea endophytica]MCS7477480.1 tubulin-like doman-containing protein [Umezawaea endophytica]
MKIYQPMMFVGLGGTGCRVGAELERRFRAELCGPDGTALQSAMPGQNFLPYQLPKCLQFVYADLAEDEFGHVESRAVPDRSHLPAAQRTMRMVRGLVPPHDTYPEVARSLRLLSSDYWEGWLPPPQGEPKVAPLSKGAGQFPTVGRAALFETFKDGLGAAQSPLADAIGDINNSGGQLSELGGKLRGSIDVFVAFSVAGGTGSGLFYDYLHLIGDALNRGQYRARIYPLVLMPSAFEEGLGGGRAAKLNSGRALLDLFRMVDEQNSSDAGIDLDSRGVSGSLAVRYPARDEIKLRPSTVQTAFLFSGNAGMRREDLHRSVVSMVLSLVGSDLPRDSDGKSLGQQEFQSFADSFINKAAERSVQASTGIGRKGVSTSSVASLTVPDDELADIVSSRLLADAVRELSEPPPGQAENNRELVAKFFTDANIDPVWHRAAIPVSEPAASNGADAILAALGARARTMEANLFTLGQQLAQQVPQLTQNFDPHSALRSLLGSIDLFRLRRVVMGHEAITDEVSKRGFGLVLESRRSEPQPPPGISLIAPAPQVVRARMIGRAKFSDPSVRDSIRRQNDWYTWRGQCAWHAAWGDQASRWERKLRAAQRDLTDLTKAFEQHAQSDNAMFERRSRALFEHRVGVSYLLPRQGDLGAFYAAVVRRFVDHYVEVDRLRPAATTAQVVGEILGDQGWRTAFEIHQERDAAQAVSYVRGELKKAVKWLFTYNDNRQPLLPRMHDLLTAASGREKDRVSEEDLAQFQQKLAGLVPGGFAPSGKGQLKVLYSYPASNRDVELENLLRREIYLPANENTHEEFRPVDTESIAVVLVRSSMGLTEVDEVREVLRFWAEALHDDQHDDFLHWRQRLDYQSPYLATTADDRTRILHHLLCAVWNGEVVPTGTDTSPESITVSLGVNMRLDLQGYGHRSSWGSVIAAYERWVLADSEDIRRQFCEKLTRSVPARLTSTPSEPSRLFLELVSLAETEPKHLTELLAQNRESGRRRLESLLEFWEVVFPAAMELRFGDSGAVEHNLRALHEWFSR